MRVQSIRRRGPGARHGQAAKGSTPPPSLSSGGPTVRPATAARAPRPQKGDSLLPRASHLLSRDCDRHNRTLLETPMNPNMTPDPVNRWATEHYGFNDEPAPPP